MLLIIGNRIIFDVLDDLGDDPLDHYRSLSGTRRCRNQNILGLVIDDRLLIG